MFILRGFFPALLKVRFWRTTSGFFSALVDEVVHYWRRLYLLQSVARGAMIPMDTNSDSGPHAVEREVGRFGDRREVDSVRRDTILQSPSKAAATRLLPRRSTRLATSGFRGVKRSRLPLKLPTGRTLRAQVSRVAEGSRTVAGEGSSTPIGTAMSKVDLRSTALTSESDDAVVPR